MDQDTKEFLHSLEQENGGKIIFKTYAVLIGFTNEKNINLGGLLYIINDTLYFEDFEKQGGLFSLIPLKKTRSYKKYKTSIDINSIKTFFSVKIASAKAVVGGKKSESQLRTVNGLKKKLFQTAVYLSRTGKPGLLLEVIDDNTFMDAITKELQ